MPKAKSKKSDIQAQLKGLEPPQKAAVVAMLRKLTAGERLLKSDIGLLGYPFRAMTPNLTAEFFRVSRQSIHLWDKDGCPRNPDGTYDLFALHQWLVEREAAKHKKEGSLKDEKTKEEIEKLRLNNQNLKNIMMPREEHTEKIRSWAASFKAFWEQAVRRNSHMFVQRSQAEIDVMFDEFGRKLMEVWSGS